MVGDYKIISVNLGYPPHQAREGSEARETDDEASSAEEHRRASQSPVSLYIRSRLSGKPPQSSFNNLLSLINKVAKIHKDGLCRAAN